MEKQKKAIEKAIKSELAYFKNEYACLKSVKGIGDVISAELISEIAGISKFKNDNSLAEFSGIYWNYYQTAGFTSDEPKLRKCGNKYLRYYFIQDTDQLRKYLPDPSGMQVQLILLIFERRLPSHAELLWRA